MRSLLGFSLKSYRATLLGWLATSRPPTSSIGGVVAPLSSLRGQKQALRSSRFDCTRLQLFSSLGEEKNHSRNMTEVIASLQQLDKNVRIQIP
eukprot:scaffold5017_cov171-Amphora_coffeaeformis.AAC.33